MMKLLCKTFFIGFLLVCANTLAQNDTIQALDKVVLVADTFEQEKIVGQKKVVISEEQINTNPTNLTETLRYNSPIVFRDYGNGGVSSARFRGTSATNTAVLWNGLNINAVGSGQTDFNAIGANTSDVIVVSSGGSSAQNGSGAIGGSVSLNDNIEFQKHHNTQLFSSYGSFNTSSSYVKTNIGTGKFVLKVGGSYNVSDNDYEFIDTRYKDEDGNSLKNINGFYENYNLNIATGYKVNNKNKLYLYTTGFKGERFFSDGLPNPKSGDEKNLDINQRNLIKWENSYLGFKSQVKLAYLFQEYRYFSSISSEEYSFGKSDEFVSSLETIKRINPYVKIGGKTQYQYINGATNDIDKIRTVFSNILNVYIDPIKNLNVNLSVRGEDNSDFELPVVYSTSFKYGLNKIELTGSVSTNYRAPTFNELYWPIVGNKNLIPETSKQYEIGLGYKSKNVKFNVNYFDISLKNKIQWIPTGGTNLWRPINLDNVSNYGVEFFGDVNKSLGKHTLSLSGNYIYVNAINKATNKTLRFVPKHMTNYKLSYRYSLISFYLQGLFQSKVYTTEDNIEFYSLDVVNVKNIGGSVDLLEKKQTKLTLGFVVKNVENSLYYFSNLRPMPGRNYNININYKF